jgi:hypothetical protein
LHELRRKKKQRGSTTGKFDYNQRHGNSFFPDKRLVCPAIVLWKAPRHNAWLALFRRAGDI